MARRFLSIDQSTRFKCLETVFFVAVRGFLGLMFPAVIDAFDEFIANDKLRVDVAVFEFLKHAGKKLFTVLGSAMPAYRITYGK